MPLPIAQRRWVQARDGIHWTTILAIITGERFALLVRHSRFPSRYLLIIKIAITLLRKIKEAIEARAEHVIAFNEFNASLPENDTQEWLEVVTAWEADNAEPNPYFSAVHSMLL
jgi:hypothetical protein